MKTSQVYIILLLIDISLFLILFNTLLAGKENYGYLNKGYAMLYERNFDTKYTDELQEIVSNSLNNTNLLKLNILRRDQIWFAEKDDKNGISDLYPLSDFSVRKTENVERGYMLGRFGAVPFIKNDFNLWEEE